MPCLPLLQSGGANESLVSLPQGDLLLRADQRGREQEDWLLQAPPGLCSSELSPPLCSLLAPQRGRLRPQLHKPGPGSGGCREHGPAPAAMLVPSAACTTGNVPASPASPGDSCGPCSGLCSPHIPVPASVPWPREPPEQRPGFEHLLWALRILSVVLPRHSLIPAARWSPLFAGPP